MSVGIIKKSRSYPSQADYRYCMLQRTQTAGVGAAGQMYIRLGNIRHLIAAMHLLSKEISV